MKIRRKKDSRVGYTIDKVGDKLVVTWDGEKGVDLVAEDEVIVHEDDSMIAMMCDTFCNFEREEE